MRLSPSIVLLRTQSDDRLVALAREGWEPAFTALVERYRREVLRGCMRVLPEPRAEDAAQQVFIAAWRALQRGDEVRDVRPWLLRIARNTALNALRVPGYDHAELAESLRGGEAPQAELERREVVRATLAGLAALPERQREALLRSAVEGASHAEIAAGLGIKEGAARQLVLRARSTMRGAATALTPAPLVSWALTHAADSSLGDAVAGGSAAGAGGLLAKAGVIAVVAGGAVAAPVAIHQQQHSGTASAQAASANPARADRLARHATRARAATTAAPAATTVTLVVPAHHPRPVATVEVRRRGSGDSGEGGGSGSGDDGGHRGSGSSGSDDETPTTTEIHRSGSGDSGTSGTSGSGSGDSGHSGSDDGMTTSGSGSGESGSGGSDDGTPIATVTPIASPTPTPTSGSGSSGSGDSGRSGDDHLDG